MIDPILLEVHETSAIGELRRTASTLAEGAGLTSHDIARLSLVITELATNVIKHANGGTIAIGRSNEAAKTIEVLALDAGSGIANVAQALRDGHSTTGTPGTGLGAITRHADFFQVYTRPGHGTAVLARIGADTPSTGGLVVPFPGEPVSGDGWSEKNIERGRMLMLVDGLGHGQLAYDAANAACDAFRRAYGSVSDTLLVIHDGLRGTRGAAVAVAELDLQSQLIRFAGVGNISATIVDATARRSAVSVYGIAGHQIRDVREYTYPWTSESTLIMHSDGLTTKWDLDAYPGLLGRDPMLIAGVLWKDHHRRSDDSTVVVARAL